MVVFAQLRLNNLVSVEDSDATADLDLLVTLAWIDPRCAALLARAMICGPTLFYTQMRLCYAVVSLLLCCAQMESFGALGEPPGERDQTRCVHYAAELSCSTRVYSKPPSYICPIVSFVLGCALVCRGGPGSAAVPPRPLPPAHVAARRQFHRRAAVSDRSRTATHIGSSVYICPNGSYKCVLLWSGYLWWSRT